MTERTPNGQPEQEPDVPASSTPPVSPTPPPPPPSGTPAPAGPGAPARSASELGATEPGATEPAPGSAMWAAPEEVEDEHGHHAVDEHGHPLEPGAGSGVVATFLPGLEALSVLAVLVSALAAGVYLLLLPLVQAANGGKTWADFKNKVPTAKQDPFSLQRLYLEYQSWGHIILGLVAMLLALVVLGLWTAGKHRFWARSLAQAALVFGFCVVIYGILMRTGAIGGTLPSMKEIQDVYATQSSGVG